MGPAFSAGYDLIECDGVPLPRRRRVNFIGLDSCADDPATGTTVLTMSGGGGGGGTCANSPELLCLDGRTGTTNDPTISSDANGTITGSAAAARGLILDGNSVDGGFIQALANATALTASGLTVGLNLYPNPLDLGPVVGAAVGFAIAPQVTWNLVDDVGALAFLANGPIIANNSGGSLTINSFVGLQNFIRLEGADPIVLQNVALVGDQVYLEPNVTTTAYTTYDSTPSFEGPVGTYRGLWVRPITLNPITTLIGVDVRGTFDATTLIALNIEGAFTATTKQSLRSVDPAMSMAHTGPIRTGDDTTIGQLLIADGVGNDTLLQAQTQAGDITYTLPATSTTGVLTNDGAGLLSWDPAGSTGGAGPMGPPGLDGEPGEDGLPGPVGATGAPGATGPAGADGATGPMGIPGPAGEDGLDGMDGIPGPVGPTGPAGATGPQGAMGFPGEQGEEGPEGIPIPGPVGPTGLTGATGPAGPQGWPGEDGEAGADGLPGPPGPQGTMGLQGMPGFDGTDGEDGFPMPGAVGPTGPTGATGPQGVPGIPGEQGDEGPEGFALPGPQGATGATGATGPAGPPGVAWIDDMGDHEPLLLPMDPWAPLVASTNLGLLALTGTGTLVNRSVTASSPLSVSNGDGSTADVLITLGTVPATKGGTGQTVYAIGDILYASATNVLSKLAANSTATNKYLQSVSSGTPTWQQIAYADVSGTPDLTLYLLLAGRTGTTNNPTLSTSTDGTIDGSSASGSGLILESTSHATKGSVSVKDPLLLYTSNTTLGTAFATTYGARINAAFTASTVHVFSAFGLTGTVTDQSGTSVNGFANVATISRTTSGTSGTSTSTLNNTPTLQSDGLGITTGNNYGVVHVPVYQVINSGTIAGYTDAAIKAGLTVNASTTVATRVGLQYLDATGAGGVTNQIAVDVAALAKGGTLNAAVRSAIASSGTVNYLLQDTGGAPSLLIGSEMQLYSPTSQTVPTENFVLHGGALKLTGTQTYTLQGTAILCIIGGL